MTRFVFTEPDETASLFARIVLEGPGGGGKTYTALTLARALGDRVGVVDTEHRRALEYKKTFRFSHLPLDSFDPKDLTELIADAAEQGINPLVIDSGSPFWDGHNGMLEQVDTITANSGRNDKFGTGWLAMRPVERDMFGAMLSYPGHLIVTLRTKNEYTYQVNSATGRVGPVKVGLKPIQRDGFEYDFGFVASMHNGEMVVSKTSCPDLVGAVIHHPKEDVAYKLLDWLGSAPLPAHLDPITVRNWALEPARTITELSQRIDEISTAGLAGAAVKSPGGGVYALSEFLAVCVRKIREQHENAAAAAARNNAARNRRDAA